MRVSKGVPSIRGCSAYRPSRRTAGTLSAPPPTFHWTAGRTRYGLVVDSVYVSVLEYGPVRIGSVALIACVNVTVTTSLETGALYVLSTPRPPNGEASVNAPL